MSRSEREKLVQSPARCEMLIDVVRACHSRQDENPSASNPVSHRFTSHCDTRLECDG